jgi:hypothetical protein
MIDKNWATSYYQILVKLEKTDIDMFNLLCEAHGENTLSWERVFQWHKMSEWREEAEGDERPGRQETMRTDDCVKKERTRENRA